MDWFSYNIRQENLSSFFSESQCRPTLLLLTLQLVDNGYALAAMGALVVEVPVERPTVKLAGDSGLLLYPSALSRVVAV